jgi:hypothetical protein
MDVLIPVMFGVIGWVLRQMYDDMKELRKQIMDIQLQYVPRTELLELKHDMRDGFNEIKQLLKEL